MATTQLITSSNADRDLYAGATVLSATPDASNPRLCKIALYMGDGTKNLTSSGGAFSVTITIGGQTWMGGARSYVLGTATRAYIVTDEFAVPAGAAVTMVVSSPNSGDTDVDCTAYLFADNAPAADAIADAVWDEATSGHATAGTFAVLVTAIPTAAAIADAVWDEATSGHVTSGSFGASVLMIGIDYTWTNNGSGSGYDEVTVTRT